MGKKAAINYSKEITIAADEMLARYGERAALVAADWANNARDKGETAKYEFWQWVCMDLNECVYQATAARKRTN